MEDTRNSFKQMGNKIKYERDSHILKAGHSLLQRLSGSIFFSLERDRGTRVVTIHHHLTSVEGFDREDSQCGKN